MISIYIERERSSHIGIEIFDAEKGLPRVPIETNAVINLQLPVPHQIHACKNVVLTRGDLEIHIISLVFLWLIFICDIPHNHSNPMPQNGDVVGHAEIPVAEDVVEGVVEGDDDLPGADLVVVQGFLDLPRLVRI